MAASLELRWLRMIKIYFLHKIISLFCRFKIHDLIILCLMACAVANVYAENLEQDACENKGFDNAYYLLNKKDYAAASTFFQEIPPMKKGKFYIFPGERERVSTYYDFEDLAILNSGKELVYTLDENLPKYFKEREQVRYIDKPESHSNITSFKVKRYSKKTSSLDKHPLYGKIKRKERPSLIEWLSSFSRNSPELVKEVLRIKSTDSIYFVTFYGDTVAEIAISYFTVSNFGVPNTTMLLKIEKINKNQEELTIDERKDFESYLCQVNNDLKSQFLDAESYPWFGYEQYNKIALDNFPGRRFFQKYPELYVIGQIMCLSFIGFLIISLLLGRYSKSTAYRSFFKKNKRNT